MNNNYNIVKVYTTPSCNSCKKTKLWLKRKNIEYKEKNIYTNKLSYDEICNLLKLTNGGVKDIISTRCKYVRENKLNLDSLTLDETINLIQKKPNILRCPIIIQENYKRIQIGFHEDGIEIFLRYDADNMIITKITGK